MKVHFISSTSNLKENAELFHEIIKSIESEGALIVGEWVNAALRSPVPTDDAASWSFIYKVSMNSITDTDLIIAEISDMSFFVGFRVSSALALKKPVLLLSRTRDVLGALGVSENEDIVTFCHYNRSNLKGHISRFLNEYKNGGKSIRFNMFIDRKSLNHLNSTSQNTGETKAQIIRRLIAEDMLNLENSDQ